MLAAERGHSETVAVLLELGAKQPYALAAALRAAARSGHLGRTLLQIKSSKYIKIPPHELQHPGHD